MSSDGKKKAVTEPKSTKKKAIPKFDPTNPPFEFCSKKRATYAEAFDSLTKILEGRKRIMVLAGAGISVSCGIPDFRTKDKGLYSTLDFEVR